MGHVIPNMVRRFLLLLVVWMVGLTAFADASLCSESDLVDVTTEENNGVVQLLVKPPQVLEATVSVKLDLENMSSSPPAPFIYLIEGLKYGYKKPVSIATITRLDPRSAWKYKWHDSWKVGLPGGVADDKYLYALPYLAGEQHRCAQGHFGEFSHNKGSENEYATDFKMPEGTTVCAARDGTVVAIYVDSTVGGNDKKYFHCANFIIIKHSDGTYGSYLHLKPGGNLVNLGDRVAKSQPIALSGNTGFTAGPHLHFQVYVPIDGKTEKSLPMTFMTPEGPVSDPQEGKLY